MYVGQIYNFVPLYDYPSLFFTFLNLIKLSTFSMMTIQNDGVMLWSNGVMTKEGFFGQFRLGLTFFTFYF